MGGLKWQGPLYMYTCICLIFTYCVYVLVISGKTLLAKAVANQTSATFLRVVGSELIQKYLVMVLTEIAAK